MFFFGKMPEESVDQARKRNMFRSSGLRNNEFRDYCFLLYTPLKTVSSPLRNHGWKIINTFGCLRLPNWKSKTYSMSLPVVPGQAGGGSFQKEKNYIAKKEFAYRMCARRPTSAMPKSFLCLCSPSAVPWW